MTKDQFAAALTWAKSPAPAREDPGLMGYGLSDYRPVWTTLEGVAELLRWQCRYFCIPRDQAASPDAWWDSAAVQELWGFARYRFLVPNGDKIAEAALRYALEDKP